MSLTNTVPAWPKIDAVVRADGSGEVTINGTSHPIAEPTLDGARAAVLARVAETATKMGRPVRVATTSPDGDFPLIVHPDGNVTADVDTEARAAPTPQVRTSVGPVGAERDAVDLELRESTDPDQPVTDATDHGARAWGARAARASRTRAAGSPADGVRTRREVRQSFLNQQAVEEPATAGWRGSLARIGIRVAPSEAERAQRADIQAVSQHWPGPRTIAIVNGKGGASKTPTTALLAALFGRFGGAGVLAWDNNQTRGTLGWRTEKGAHDSTLLELLPQVDRLLGTGAQVADLARYVHHQTADKYDVLRSKPAVLASEQRITADDVDAIHAVASKYYRLVFIDSGNDETDPLWLRMIDHADQLVVATTTRDDHAEAGALLLEALADRDDRSAALAAGAVAIVSQADKTASTADVAHVAAGYRTLAREVATVPFDEAMVDGHLRFGALRPATQRAWLTAGAAVARGL